DLAARHYEAHRERPFYPGLVKFMTASPVLVLAIRGKNAIAISRKMMGATFGSNAAAGTIRGDFGVSNSFHLIPGSDSRSPVARHRYTASRIGRSTSSRPLLWMIVAFVTRPVASNQMRTATSFGFAVASA